MKRHIFALAIGNLGNSVPQTLTGIQMECQISPGGTPPLPEPFSDGATGVVIGHRVTRTMVVPPALFVETFQEFKEHLLREIDNFSGSWAEHEGKIDVVDQALLPPTGLTPLSTLKEIADKIEKERETPCTIPNKPL